MRWRTPGLKARSPASNAAALAAPTFPKHRDLARILDGPEFRCDGVDDDLRTGPASCDRIAPRRPRIRERGAVERTPQSSGEPGPVAAIVHQDREPKITGHASIDETRELAPLGDAIDIQAHTRAPGRG
jgi:hypothetical protein